MCNEKKKTAQQDKSQGRSKFKRFTISPFNFNALAQISIDYAHFGITCHSFASPSCCVVNFISSFIAADGFPYACCQIKVPHLGNTKEQTSLYIVQACGHKIKWPKINTLHQASQQRCIHCRHNYLPVHRYDPSNQAIITMTPALLFKNTDFSLGCNITNAACFWVSHLLTYWSGASTFRNMQRANIFSWTTAAYSSSNKAKKQS